ncbi:MAG TPA: ATP-binding protein [Steroidobacteraceae bacterium]|jgi:two-component system OmpR family sensor kinase|nr:ATP-binding protein [Steroidobacteraceae bacterium]
MARHFLTLYIAIVITLAAVSWGQERLWREYGGGAHTSEIPQAAVLSVLERQLASVPGEQRARVVADVARDSGLDVELLEPQDIAGVAEIPELAGGKPVLMDGADGRAWVLQRLPEGRVLAFRFENEAKRSLLDWILALVFYAAIALVIMVWLWPLMRDLRALEHSTGRFGDRNWSFDARIATRSPVYPLAAAFRRMAARIDRLIGSHKDMSNALSHEIKTPLARMRFEIELARGAADREALLRHLDHLNTDISELNAFVTATLEYAVLERAEFALNIAPHDFTAIVPAVTASVQRGARPELTIATQVDAAATAVVCDAHLIETVLRNLLYNATRYARRQIRVSFAVDANQHYRLCVEDDGPGIPEAERERVFASFVQLGQSGEKTGFGLGLAIVQRIVEWHGGSVRAGHSELGGACFVAQWYAPQPRAG